MHLLKTAYEKGTYLVQAGIIALCIFVLTGCATLEKLGDSEHIADILENINNL